MTFTTRGSKAGSADLAHTILDHVQRHFGAEWGMSEGTLGRIDIQGWLIVDGNFRGPDAKPLRFSPDEFYVLRHLTVPVDFLSLTPDGTHHTWLPSDSPEDAPIEVDGGAAPIEGQHGGHTSGDGSHFHRVQTPPQLRPPMPGDKVAVVWLDKRVPCVAGVLVSGRAIQPAGDSTYLAFAAEDWDWSP